MGKRRLPSQILEHLAEEFDLRVRTGGLLRLVHIGSPAC